MLREAKHLVFGDSSVASLPRMTEEIIFAELSTIKCTALRLRLIPQPLEQLSEANL